MATNIRFKTKVTRIFSRCVNSSPVRFSTMNRMITILPQQLNERSPDKSMFCPWHLRNPINIPYGKIQYLCFSIRTLVLLQSPVSDPMPGSVTTCHQTTPSRRTNATSISLRKHHPLSGQPLHIRSFIPFVVHCLLIPKRKRRILPSHVIHQEKNDVRFLFLLLSHSIHYWQHRQRK